MIKNHQKIAIFLLSLSLMGLLDKSSSKEYLVKQSFPGWFLTLLQGEQKKSRQQPIQTSIIHNFFQSSPLKPENLVNLKLQNQTF